MNILKELSILFIIKFTTLVYCDGEQEIFCWVFQAKLPNANNVSGNIIHWNYLSSNQITKMENNKTHGQGVACSPHHIMPHLQNTCWNFVRENTSFKDRINYILEIFNQFSPWLAESNYTARLINNWSVPICFTGESEDCKNGDKAHISLNFTFPSTSKRNNAYFPFENIYSSDHFNLNNSLRICFLFHRFFQLISCLEKPPEKPMEFNNLILYKREVEKKLDRNIICVPSHVISKDPEILVLPSEMLYIHTVLFGMSLIFLSLFLIECLLITELQEYPKCFIMWLSLSLLLSRIFSMTLIHTNMTSYYTGCFIIVLFYRIFSLGTFCWISVFGYDMWVTFKNVNSNVQECLSYSKKKIRMLRYFLFAWGLPTVIAITEILVLNFAPAKSNYHFKTWKNSCTSWTKHTQNLFHSLPTAIILLTNFVFFSLTVNKIKKSNQQIVQSKAGTKLTRVIIKLSILFGFPWILTVISDIVNYYQDNSVVYYIAIVLSSSQGFFILFFFGCTQSMHEKLKEKLNYVNGNSER